MKRRDFLKATMATVATTVMANGISGKKNTQPNLLFIFPDQLRVQALGFLKEDPTITPNIDKFASESLFFENAVSNWPLCSPYRGMLMTGRWPYSTGITTNCNSSRPEVYLKDEEVAFTDVLAKEGYDVGYIGKWHLDTPRDVPVVKDWRKAEWECFVPKQRRHGINFWHAYNCNNKHMHPYYWIGDAKADEQTHFEQYSPDHEADIASKYILNTDGKQRDPNKPFAMFVAMNPPHGPYDQVPEKYKQLYKNRPVDELIKRPNVNKKMASPHIANYFAQVTGVDVAFGEIMDSLEKSGLADNTIVVFSADHGEMMGGHSRMQKVVIYEESFRIPFIVRWPGKIKPGTDNLHINVPDMMPTLLSLLGLKKSIPQAVEGSDYSPVFAGKDFARPTTSFYIRCGGESGQGRGVRDDRFTLEVSKNKENLVINLYDRKEDPYQMKNFANDKPAVVKRLRKELNNWLVKTNDPKKELFS